MYSCTLKMTKKALLLCICLVLFVSHRTSSSLIVSLSLHLPFASSLLFVSRFRYGRSVCCLACALCCFGFCCTAITRHFVSEERLAGKAKKNKKCMWCLFYVQQKRVKKKAKKKDAKAAAKAAAKGAAKGAASGGVGGTGGKPESKGARAASLLPS